jgi:thioredoxin-dependent peroxiredoxin
MVGDPEGKVLGAFGVRWPLVGFARRVTYVIGADRRVQEVIRGEFDVNNHVTEACGFVARPTR